MGHVDGLSRSHNQTINAIAMAELLNDADESSPSTVEVGETAPFDSTLLPTGSLLQSAGDSSLIVPPDEEGATDQCLVSPVDVFGLQQTRFVEEQKRPPWIQAMIAFLSDEALALDP